MVTPEASAGAAEGLFGECDGVFESRIDDGAEGLGPARTAGDFAPEGRERIPVLDSDASEDAANETGIFAWSTLYREMPLSEGGDHADRQDAALTLPEGLDVRPAPETTRTSSYSPTCVIR